MFLCRKAVVAGWAAVLTLSASALAQATPPPGTPPPDSAPVQSTSTSALPAVLPNEPKPVSPLRGDNPPVTIKNTIVHSITDMPKILTSPLRLDGSDQHWFLPLEGAAGVSLILDRHTMSKVVSKDSDFNRLNINTSNGALAGEVALPFALFTTSLVTGNPHARETGILSGQAVLDSMIVTQGLKLILFRERPDVDGSAGRFFIGHAGPDSSFPSSHSTIAWASAAVLAEEYPQLWKQIGVYTLATGVSLTRVLGQEHFPTDVLIGGAIGYLVGHYVYKTHHSRIGTTDYRQK